MKRLSTLLMLLGTGMFVISGCQDSVEEEAEDVSEAQEDLQHEQVEAIDEIQGEVNEGNREITGEQQELLEENQELNEAISEEQGNPAVIGPNTEGDADTIEEVEPQN